VRETGSEDKCLLVPGGGLTAHEMLGGHTLAKHVGKSEAYLRHRLATEPAIRAASTFFDRESAESALAELIVANVWVVTRWLRGIDRDVTIHAHAQRPAGIVLARGTAGPTAATGIRLVLRRNSGTPTGFRIHTAMVIR
jgi:hypothetical protein